MKIALLLTGHLRSFRKTHDSFLRLKQLLSQQGEVDVFAHTWDIEESVTASWWKDHAADAPPPPNVDASELERLYQPVSYQIEPSRQFQEIPVSIKSIIPVSGLLSMLYSQHRAFVLMEEYARTHQKTYEVVVKMRYDLGFEIAPAFASLLPRSVAESCLFVPNSNPYELTGACADIFAIGAKRPMESYLRFYEHFETTLRQYEAAGFRELVPERCLKTYLENQSVLHKEIEGIRIHILRSNGNMFRICSDQYFESNEPLCFFGETIGKNLAVLPEGSDQLSRNQNTLIQRYTHWIRPSATKSELESYTRFYQGEWISAAAIRQLAQASAEQRVLHPSVMKSFFEQALRASKAGFGKKARLALLLAHHTREGLFFIRVFIRSLI